MDEIAVSDTRDGWTITLLGGFRSVSESGAVVERFRTQKALLLLARLLLASPASVSREQLGEWLWPDRSPTDQRARLRYEVSVLRSTLGAEAVLSVGNHFLKLNDNIASDVAAFRQAAARSQWERAVNLYAGDLLPGIYDDWIIEQQTFLRQHAYDTFRQALAKAQSENAPVEARQIYRLLKERFPDSDLPEPQQPLPLPDRVSHDLAGESGEPEATFPTVPFFEPKSTGTAVYGKKRKVALALFVAGGVSILTLQAKAVLLPEWNLCADFRFDSPMFHNWSLGQVFRPQLYFQLMDRSDFLFDNVFLHWYRNFEKGDFNKNITLFPVHRYNAVWQPGQLALHPNEGARPTTAIRWTCPTAGEYAAHTRFSGLSTNFYRGTTVDIFLHYQTKLVWKDSIRGSAILPVHINPRPIAQRETVVPMAPGETLTWHVDDAGTFYCDQVGVEIIIRPLWLDRIYRKYPLTLWLVTGLPYLLFVLVSLLTFRRLSRFGPSR